MRAIPDSMDPGIVSAIDRRLDAVEADRGVRILWAIESGSRAWGFPSPDSDYDARFLYVRPAASYLSPWPARDVIDTPLDKVFDVNGWDLAKAVRLLVKGNGTVGEWLRSPIAYRGDEAFRDALHALADDVVDRALLGRHYLHVGLNQAGGRPSIKRLFYQLRPAAILRWMERHPSGIPPMDLMTAAIESEIPAELIARIEELIALKAVTREADVAEVPADLAAFVATEFTRAERYEDAEPTDRTGVIARAEAFFAEAVARWSA